MEQKIIPPTGSRMCPEIPPDVRGGPLGQPVITFFPCMGEPCAKHDYCQGDHSPRAREARLTARVLAILNAVESFGVAFPGVGALVRAIHAAFRPDPAPGSARN